MNQRKVKVISFNEMVKIDRQTELENTGNSDRDRDRQADVKPVISSRTEVGHLTEGGGCYFRALLEIKAGDKSLEI